MQQQLHCGVHILRRTQPRRYFASLSHCVRRFWPISVLAFLALRATRTSASAENDPDATPKTCLSADRTFGLTAKADKRRQRVILRALATPPHFEAPWACAPVVRNLPVGNTSNAVRLAKRDVQTFWRFRGEGPRAGQLERLAGGPRKLQRLRAPGPPESRRGRRPRTTSSCARIGGTAQAHAQ
jgi:hypothetical protein